MLYPSNIKKTYCKNTDHASRGMGLEAMINEANTYYLNNNKALIYKKPTPITISNVEYPNNKKVVTKGLFQTKSTLDYVGLYKGAYLDFDAKSTKNKTSFPLANIQNHQLQHIKRVIENKGISFLIIQVLDNYFLFRGEDLLSFIATNERKSIPINYIKEKGFEIKLSYNPVLNYLKVIDQIYFKEELK